VQLLQLLQAPYSMLLRFEVSRSGLELAGAQVLSLLALPVQKCKILTLKALHAQHRMCCCGGCALWAAAPYIAGKGLLLLFLFFLQVIASYALE